jgi:hypothetical protein
MMKRMLATGCVALLLCGGCASYYKVTDPTTSKAYYTQQVDRQGNGATTFKDARTGNIVTLQNTEVDPVTKEEFEQGLRQPAQLPAPAPAPAPTPSSSTQTPAPSGAQPNAFQ